MKYPTRIYYTETDKAMMWDRWQQGGSLHSIARLFDAELRRTLQHDMNDDEQN